MSALNVEEFALTVGHSCRLGFDVVSCFNQPSDVACNREGHGIAFFIDSILFDLITAARPMDDASVWFVESTLKERALNEVNDANPRTSSDCFYRRRVVRRPLGFIVLAQLCVVNEGLLCRLVNRSPGNVCLGKSTTAFDHRAAFRSALAWTLALLGTYCNTTSTTL